MFGLEELRRKIDVKGDMIICPVIGCENQVENYKRRPKIIGYLS